MQSNLECVVFGLKQTKWMHQISGEYLSGRLQLCKFNCRAKPELDNSALDGGDFLSDAAILHGRFDAALIHIDQGSLSHWRTVLVNAAKNSLTPLIIYSEDLRAQALHDLLETGAADFIRAPFSAEELRTRIEYCRLRSRPIALSEKTKKYSGVSSLTEEELSETILERSGAEIEACATALAMQTATCKESMRSIKTKIIARFERAYMSAALRRHNGNVTMAARLAQKNRRAFWALMRKHQIEPSKYRP